jgi:hypothetical protein
MARRVDQQIIILGASAVAVSGAADTNENILATITIPAGAMGLNGILRVYADYTVTNNANAKTLRVRLSGIGGTVLDSKNAASVRSASPTRQTTRALHQAHRVQLIRLRPRRSF